jgi:serine/threonine protein kinase
MLALFSNELRRPQVHVCSPRRVLPDAPASTKLLERPSMKPFALHQRLGSGTFGDVYSASQPQDDGTIAHRVVKRFRTLDDHDEEEGLEEEGVPQTALREIATLKALQRNNVHPNICQVFGVLTTEDPPTISMVLERCDYDLRQCLSLRFPTGMPAMLLRSVTRQVLSGLDFCHGRGVIHRDLKPHNVLINRTGECKICDFGLAAPCPRVCAANIEPREPMSEGVGTKVYMSPEALFDESSPSAGLFMDVWGVGCIMAEAANGKQLFDVDARDELDVLRCIFRLLGTPTEATWSGVTRFAKYGAVTPRAAAGRATPPDDQGSAALEIILRSCNESGKPPPSARWESDALDLLCRLLSYEPTARPTARSALAHALFDERRHGCSSAPIALDDVVVPTPTRTRAIVRKRSRVHHSAD